MKVLVAGASGVVGRAALAQCALKGIPAVGLSRRAPDLPHTEHIPCDLTDPESCELAIGQLDDVTHVIYAALYEKPGLVSGWTESDQMQTNLNMLLNLLTPLLGSPNNLQHIALLQGTKAYGAHVHPMRIPGKEREPRDPHENFYWLQEDALKYRQQGQSWHYSIWRPQVVIGHAAGSAMNMLAAIGIHAAFCRFEDEPLYYPGGPNAPIEATDTNLLARAMLFGLAEPKCQNEIYNVTNGDVFVWQNVWDAIAVAVNMPAGLPKPCLLADYYKREADWQQIVKKYGLQERSLRALAGESLYYADALFATGRSEPPPALVSTVKLRQAGFAECLDTEDMFSEWFKRLRMLRVVP